MTPLTKTIVLGLVSILATTFLASCDRPSDPDKLKPAHRAPTIAEGEAMIREQENRVKKYEAMTPEERRIRQEEEDKVRAISAAARPFYPLLDKFKTMDEEDVQEEIEGLFERLNFAEKWGDGSKGENYFEFCKEAFEKKDARTLWNMIKAAEKNKDWEFYATKCLEDYGGISDSVSGKLLHRWAALVDVMEKPHLVFLLGWRPDGKNIARKLVESPRYLTWQKCRGMNLIANRGSAEDIKFLEKEVGKHIMPIRDSSPVRSKDRNSYDCARLALDNYEREKKRQQEKKTKP